MAARAASATPVILGVRKDTVQLPSVAAEVTVALETVSVPARAGAVAEELGPADDESAGETVAVAVAVAAVAVGLGVAIRLGLGLEGRTV
jgi:hypothetical protein